jgi:ribonuclease D
LNALGKKQLSMYGASLVQVIEEALEIPDAELPTYPRKKAPATPPEVPSRVRALKIKRDALARVLGIDPAMLCNKSLLYAIAARNPLNPSELKDVPGLKNWQKKVFGTEAVRVLRKEMR